MAASEWEKEMRFVISANSVPIHRPPDSDDGSWRPHHSKYGQTFCAEVLGIGDQNLLRLLLSILRCSSATDLIISAQWFHIFVHIIEIGFGSSGLIRLSR
jgi:hypothetical protein